MEQRWFVPIYDNDRIGKGSDGAHACSYVRKDCVHKFVQGIADKVIDGHKVKEIYWITRAQFWSTDWYNVDTLRKVGRLVYNKDRGFII